MKPLGKVQLFERIGLGEMRKKQPTAVLPQADATATSTDALITKRVYLNGFLIHRRTGGRIASLISVWDAAVQPVDSFPIEA